MKHRFTLWCCFLAVLFSVQSQAQNRSYPFSWDNATVYFLLNDRFNNGDPSNDSSYGRSRNSPNGELDFQGGDLRGITQKINDGYFDELGVNAIWITAPYEQMHGPIGSENAYAFAGYWTKDWSQMDGNMGSEQDLQTLIDTAHDHGIRIVMDIVLNHTGYPTAIDAAWPTSWVRNDCEGGDTDRYCPLAGLPDIRTNITSGHVDLPQWLLDKWQAAGIKDKELGELDDFFVRTGYPRTPRYYIIKWLIDWVREYGVDGFRIDTAKHLEVEAWGELKREAVQALRDWKNANPTKKPDDSDFWMTGEVFGQSIYDGKNYYFDHGFDNVINFGFKGDLAGKSQEAIFSDYANRVNNTDGFNILSYIASHDVAPYDRSNLYYAGTTLMLAPGGVQIYYGDESGREFFSPQTYGDAGYRKFMNWNEIENNSATQNLLGHWRKLGRFRREHISVGAGSHEKLSDSPYIFRRSYNKNGVSDKSMVVMGIEENSSPYTLDVQGTFAEGTVLKDYFSGIQATVNGGKATFNTSYGMLLVAPPFGGDSDVVTLDVQPQSGHYQSAINISMSASTTSGESVAIYYTVDGSEPNKNAMVWTSPRTLGSDLQPVTIKAKAYDSADNESPVVERRYTFGEMPGFDLHFKNTNNWNEVYVYLFDKNANTPLQGWEWPGKAMTKEGDSPWYKYSVDTDVEIGMVFNNKNQGQQSDDLFRQTTGWYDGAWHDACPGDCPVVVEPPVLSISPAGTSFDTSIEVVLSATNGGEIYYTTDESAPSKSSTLYTEALQLTATTTVKAMAYNEAGESNAVAEIYEKNNIVNVPVVTISPASGTYFNPVEVQLSATHNGEIYFTTDGSQPSQSTTKYTAPFTLQTNGTVKAIAYNADGASEIKQADYQISEFDGPQDDKFTWDNALVYFVMTDRFYNGDPSNDQAYGRGLDGNGLPYDKDAFPSRDAGMFHGGDIKGLSKKLQDGYFERIGVNAIWVTAPYEQIHGWVGGGPNGDFVHYPYHGYYTLDWSEMDQAMGSPADFQEFVDLAHSKGIRVVMDIVLNHVGYTNFADGEEYGYGCWDDAWKGWRPATETGWHDYHEELVDYTCDNWGNYWGSDWVRHPDIAGYDACSPGGGIPNCVGFLPDIKTETTTETALPPILVAKWKKEGTYDQKVAEIDAWFARTGLVKTPANYIIFWITEWIRKYGVDGLRIDTAKHVELEIWKRLKEQGNDALAEWKAENPTKALDALDLWMTAEVWGHGPGKSEYFDFGFNSVINFGLKNDGRLGREPASLESLFSEYANNINSDPDFNVLSYVSSHDVTPLFPREMLKEIAPAFVLLPGGVQIFYGDEAARPEGTYADEEQNTRSDFDWNAYDNETLAVFEQLGRFRKNHPAVGAGSHKKLGDSPYFFMRDYENATLKQADRVAIAIGANGSTTLDVSEVFQNGDTIIDAYTQAEYVVAGHAVTVAAHQEGIILLEYKTPPAYQIKPVVRINPKGMYSENPIDITIATSDEKGRAVTTYYTTDEALSSDDLAAWTIYTDAFTLEESATLRVIAEAEDGVRASMQSERYAIGAIEPFLVHVWSPNGVPNIYTWDAEPTGVNPDMDWPGEAMQAEGAEGWYVVAIPALSSKIIFLIDGVQTEDLERKREGWFRDGQWFEECPGDCPGTQVPLVAISPAGKNFSDGQGSVSIAATGADAIFYTTDGTTPDQSSMPYNGSFLLSGNDGESVTVKAIAINEAGASNVVSETYTFEFISGFTAYFWSPTCVPNVHVWNALPDGSHPETTWPGNSMTPVENTGWYSYYIPANSANVIFNNCNGQTADLSRSSDGWFRDGVWTETCMTNCPTVQKAIVQNADLASDEFRVYPNPSAGVLFLNTGDLSSNAQLILTNVSGKIVLNQPVYNERTKLDLNALAKGVYLLKFINKGEISTAKVVIK